jgi:hypothetical protein
MYACNKWTDDSVNKEYYGKRELQLSKKTIETLFEALGRELAHHGIVERVRIVVFGGVYMLFIMNARDTTHDVDIVLAGLMNDDGEEEDTPEADAFRRAFTASANAIAKAYQIPRNWINTDGAMLVAPCIPTSSLCLFASYGILDVYFPSKENMLALKLTAFRPNDRGDVHSLCADLNIRRRDQAQAILDRFVPRWWQEENRVPRTLRELFP